MKIRKQQLSRKHFLYWGGISLNFNPDTLETQHMNKYA
jgi:hypothetical protein